MAHHNNTPKSILNAPQINLTRDHEFTGRNRQMRRHFTDMYGKQWFAGEAGQVKPKTRSAYRGENTSYRNPRLRHFA